MGKVCSDNYDCIKYYFYFYRVSYVEEQAVRNLIEKFTANKSRLMKEFLHKDPNKTGKKNNSLFIDND